MVCRILISLLCCFPLLSLAAQPPDLEALAGTYVGEVSNGGGMVPMTTVFEVSPDGRLSGSYRVEDVNYQYEGVLSNFQLLEGGGLGMEWTDRFGEGFIEIEFASNYSRFYGVWGNYDMPQTLPLNGVRQ